MSPVSCTKIWPIAHWGSKFDFRLQQNSEARVGIHSTNLGDCLEKTLKITSNRGSPLRRSRWLVRSGPPTMWSFKEFQRTRRFPLTVLLPGGVVDLRRCTSWCGPCPRGLYFVKGCRHWQLQLPMIMVSRAWDCRFFLAESVGAVAIARISFQFPQMKFCWLNKMVNRIESVLWNLNLILKRLLELKFMVGLLWKSSVLFIYILVGKTIFI